MKNLSDSKQNHLSEEELLELSKISSGRNLFSRFVEQNLVFRSASIFLALTAVLGFVFSLFVYVSIDPTDIVAQSYRVLLRAWLFIIIAFTIGLVVSFNDGRVFRGFLLTSIILLSSSIDMYFFYNEFLSQADVVFQVLYYTRPVLFVALILMYINYNKS